MKLFRNCPSFLIIYSESIEDLVNDLSGILTLSSSRNITSNKHETVEETLAEATENQTIVFITDHLSEFVTIGDIQVSLIFDHLIYDLFTAIINHSSINSKIERIRKGPDLITMKNYGDIEAFYESVKKDLRGHSGTTFDLLELNNKGTIISFTNYNINNQLSLQALYDKALYTQYSKEDVINRISYNGIKYINDSISKKGWNEYKIKIYDAYDQYTYHYNRLLFIIDQLNLGLVLKEGWGQDAGTLFKHVQVYELFLYTTKSPEDMKRILVGAEYLDDGQRFVDLDLFMERKKVRWSILRDSKTIKKADIGAKCREDLIDQLSAEDVKTLRDYEKRIIREK